MLQFHPFEEKHLPLFRHWLNQEHIKLVWQEPESDEELKDKFLTKLPQRGVRSFVICENESPIGYIQYYEAAKIGGGWWPDEKPGVFGVDLMIGEPHLIGQGLGPRVIKEFTSVIRLHEPQASSLIIDPEPNNKKAIRAFQKVGFEIECEITTPGGAALLMRLPICESKTNLN